MRVGQCPLRKPSRIKGSAESGTHQVFLLNCDDIFINVAYLDVIQLYRVIQTYQSLELDKTALFQRVDIFTTNKYESSPIIIDVICPNNP